MTFVVRLESEQETQGTRVAVLHSKMRGFFATLRMTGICDCDERFDGELLYPRWDATRVERMGGLFREPDLVLQF